MLFLGSDLKGSSEIDRGVRVWFFERNKCAQDKEEKDTATKEGAATTKEDEMSIAKKWLQAADNDVTPVELRLMLCPQMSKKHLGLLGSTQSDRAH